MKKERYDLKIARLLYAIKFGREYLWSATCSICRR